MPEENNKKQKIFMKPWFQSVTAIVIIFGALGAFIYWQSTRNIISIENSYLDAPVTSIAPTSPGTLNALYVKDGDRVEANSQIALVGSETLFSKDGGLVTNSTKVLGGYFAPGQGVASIVADQKMRVVASIEENKGLDKIAAGERATFTVDTFPGRTYEGQVEEVSPISNDNSVVFSISDKRPIKKFDVYIRFDASKYPELKTGMSAKAKIYTNS